MIDHLSNTNYNAVYRKRQVKSQSAIDGKTAIICTQYWELCVSKLIDRENRYK